MKKSRDTVPVPLIPYFNTLIGVSPVLLGNFWNKSQQDVHFHHLFLQQQINELEYKMTRMKSAFPNRDPMELQDLLRSHDLNLEAALHAAASSGASKESPATTTSPKGKVRIPTVRQSLIEARL
jgi:hypothetical protein